MPERDGYIPGVPCWVDTIHPTLKMPSPSTVACSDGSSRTCCPKGRRPATSSAGCVVATLPPLVPSPKAAADGDLEYLHMGRQRRGYGEPSPRRQAAGRDGALRRHGRGADGCSDRSRRRRIQRLAGEAPQGCDDCERAWVPELQRPRDRNPEEAKAFYGAVFGWNTLALPGGEMWTLPGYGDHLEKRTPGLRERDGADGWARRLHRRCCVSTRLRTATPERRRTGASPSPSTTPTPRRRKGESSVARSSPVHSMLLGPGWW